MDYYKLLGISKNADQEEIKKAYKEQALKWHPDKNKDKDALNNFRNISEAYQILSDPIKREEYDNMITNKNKMNYRYQMSKQSNSMSKQSNSMSKQSNSMRDPFEMYNEINEINEVFSVINNMFMMMDTINNLSNMHPMQILNRLNNMEIHIIDMRVPYQNTGPIIEEIYDEEPVPLPIKNKWITNENKYAKTVILNDKDLNKIIKNSVRHIKFESLI